MKVIKGLQHNVFVYVALPSRSELMRRIVKARAGSVYSPVYKSDEVDLTGKRVIDTSTMSKIERLSLGQDVVSRSYIESQKKPSE